MTSLSLEFFSLQSAICSLQSAVCSLQSAVCSLQSANVRHRILCFPRIERRSHSTRQNSSHFTLQMKYLPWSLCCENHSITCSSSSGYLGVKRPIVARFADILSSPERIVAWSLLQRRTMDSLSPYSRAISGFFFYNFSFRDNFYLESHSIRRAACFWHDDKNNSDERDTR